MYMMMSSDDHNRCDNISDKRSTFDPELSLHDCISSFIAFYRTDTSTYTIPHVFVQEYEHL
jgi:hypothetical protein